jgi:hypothetical protein
MVDIPAPVARIAELMSGFHGTWSLCGGWAVDAWIGRETRHHDDVDIAVFDQDQRAIFDQLQGWTLVAHDSRVPDDTTEVWAGRRLELPAHVHAEARDGFALEVLLNERSDGHWVLSREPSLSEPVDRCIEPSPWGIPALVPELLLYFKATAYLGEGYDRPHDELDFAALLPRLAEPRRVWLADALRLTHPSHPWLDRLQAS